MGLTKPIQAATDGTDENKIRSAIVDWVFQCYDARVGGFGGNCSGENPHDAHLLYILSALQVLAISNSLDDERLDKDAIANYVSSLQNEDGSFSGMNGVRLILDLHTLRFRAWRCWESYHFQTGTTVRVRKWYQKRNQ